MKSLNYLFILILSLVSCSIFASEVNLRDKISQMLIIGFEGKKLKRNSVVDRAINEHNIGGVILFDYNQQTDKFDKNIANPKQVQHLNHDLQRINQTANRKHNRPQLPLIIAVDYEGGQVNRLNPSYGFPNIPSAARIGKLSDTFADLVAHTMADTLVDAEFNVNFAPVLDVNVNPDNPVIGQKERSFSADPAQVAHYANIYAAHFLDQNIQCAYKHFPGHGSSTADSHKGFVDVTDTWRDDELLPYQQLINGSHSCGMIMTAHIINRQLDESGLPATLSEKMISGLLRNQLGYEGVIVSDDMQMKAISDNYGLDKALTLAINAGVNMFIFGNQYSDKTQDPAEIINLIESKVKTGEISEAKIDESYARIVAFKNSIKKATI